MSLTDGGIQPTMPVQPANNYGGGMGMWGDNWIWIVVLFLFGWGRNGWGGNGNGSGGVMDGYVLTSDFANLERKLDGVNSGLCDGFYAMNTGMLNGFAGVTQAVTNGFSQAEVARCNAQMAFMQQLNALQAQIASCCCEQREAIQNVNYNLATQACDTRNLVQNTTRDIIDAMNCGFRSIDQRLTAQELAAKDAKIAEQNQRLFISDLAASQNAQTLDLRNYVSAQLAYYNPRPVPSFAVPAPYQYAGCNGYNGGYNYGCGGCAA